MLLHLARASLVMGALVLPGRVVFVVMTMFNSDQTDYMRYLASVPPDKKCWCVRIPSPWEPSFVTMGESGGSS
jgi:hypothetical protein